MGYKLSATIKNRNSNKTPDEIYLVSFGIRLGEEVFDYKFDAGVFERIREVYRGMMKKTPKEKKPMTFSWFVLSEQKMLFQNFKNKKLDIRVAIVNQDNKNTWYLAFEEAVLSDPKPDHKDFPGYKRQDERFDATFIKFVDDPR
jgi:hypothetical protein